MTIFTRLGRLVADHALLWVVFWVVLALGVDRVAPPWDDVTQPGEFEFLPSDFPTRVGERLFESAFPDDLLGSSVVLVLYREDGQPLNDEQQTFINERLKQELQTLTQPPSPGSADDGSNGSPAGGETSDREDSRENSNDDAAGEESASEESADGDADGGKPGSRANQPIHELIAEVRTPSDESIGRLLESSDGSAQLVILELRTEFLEHRNRDVVARIEAAIDRLRNGGAFPDGLKLALTGSAAVGRDISQAESDSADATEFWTITLLVSLLILMFRAPLLSLVPLLTLFVAFSVALKALALAADLGWIGLFRGIDTYTMVVVYGAGVDYSLFLSARVREELARGADPKAAVATAIEKVGSAIVASAGTEIFGIGMLMFASFGKLHQAGITIPFGLIVMLFAALTLTPALLRLGSPWIFWPQSFESNGETRWWHRTSPTRAAAKLFEENPFEGVWRRVGRALTRRPRTIFLVTFAVMLIPAAIGVRYYNRLTYGLISQLSPNAPSVRGMDVLRRHFASGETGHVTLLIERPGADFTERSQISAVGELSERLAERADELQIADIRSVAEPLGITDAADLPRDNLSTMQVMARRTALRKLAIDHYVSESEGTAGTVTRMTIVLAADPLTRDSIAVLDDVEAAVRDQLPDELADGSTLHFIGPTASIRDLKHVAGNDRIRINVLVVVAVLGVLIPLLWNGPLSVCLVLSVVFSYLVALGITVVAFMAMSPQEFAGLDWTVPLFLFTILVAVGVDYNIFLVSRVSEERQQLGLDDAVVEALTRTGAIITSCGVIMAGTFSSLMVGGELARMDQLGFALATGIALDTFLVRPVLVPAFLLLAGSGRLPLPQRWLDISVGAMTAKNPADERPKDQKSANRDSDDRDPVA